MNRLLSLLRHLWAVSLLALAFAPTVYAQSLPISVQGLLTTPDGDPVPNGRHQVDVRLYRQASGGTAFWQETQTAETRDGLFALHLGTKQALDPAFFEEAAFLALTVDGEDLQPRTPLSAVPRALRAGHLDAAALEAGANVSITENSDGRLRISASGGSGGGGGLSFVTSDGTLEGEGTSGSPLRLAERAVEGEHLAEGALVAGANVTLTRQGNGALEIATSGGNGTGGLTRVASDATLAGEGTAAAPLQVAVPLVLAGADDDGVVQGAHSNGNRGQLGGNDYGAYGEHNSGNRGWFGSSTSGAYGEHTSGTQAWLATGSYGAYGRHANGHYGILGGDAFGVFGEHTNGNVGHLGDNNSGAYGEHTNGTQGWLATASSGVVGQHNSGNWGALGTSNRGAYAENTNGNRGLLAGNAYGAYGEHTNGHWGALGTDDHAGYFSGNVQVTGTLSKGGGAFKIDHPLNPAGQYLSHSFVESPDMMNVYNGNVTLDAAGEAVVELPAYFEALNRDFRYQLTCIGGFAPVYVAEEMTGNTFTIAGGTPGMKVSWQVTGIRQDAWAEEHRIVVEEDKPAVERGFYLHPHLYDQPAERSVAWARDPKGMRALQERPAQIEAKQRQMNEEHRLPKPRPDDGQQ